MTRDIPARRASRTASVFLFSCLLTAFVVIALAAQLESSVRTSSSPSPLAVGEHVTRILSSSADGTRGNAVGVDDGVVPDAVTAFDDEYPAVFNLDSDLLSALRRAASDAAAQGIALYINSGWRSSEYQQQLLDEAIASYGSVEEASRWVASPTTSAHVSGDAVDIGPPEGAAWLSEFGAAYGLCQIYSNEAWHFELRPAAVTYGCSPMYLDPTYDPRM